MKKKYGFNFLWMYVWEDGKKAVPPDEKALDFVAETGFNFVRIPLDYRFWTREFNYMNPDEDAFNMLDLYIKACNERGLHLSLNFHRAPGYCINNNDLERDNLWLDSTAQDGFMYQWQLLAQRYKGVSSEKLSFDLINEPPGVGMYGLSRENHAGLIRKTVKAIHNVDPDREIVIDGLGGGNLAMPELADAGVIHSGRGYQPFVVSHYKASWVKGAEDFPVPVYPDTKWQDKTWNKETLREFYQPWLEVQKMGCEIHIGEFGCFNKTPNNVALRWLSDLTGLYKEFGWGYSLWNFTGSFGIIEHGRPGTVYENYKGYKVDRQLLDILVGNMVEE